MFLESKNDLDLTKRRPPYKIVNVFLDHSARALQDILNAQG